jgi:hypothetical protein
MVLGPSQADLLDRAKHLLAGRGAFQNLLFVGPKGCGKRTVSQELATMFGMEFVRVPMDDTADALSNCLFGTQEEASRAPSGGPLPGVFGTSHPTLLYLDRFHAVPPDLLLPMQQVISRRRYSAADGTRYCLSDDLVVVAGLRNREPDANVTPEHHVCTAFTARVDCAVPVDESELISIAKGILSTLDPRRTLAPDVGTLLQEVARGEDHLHSFRRLLRLSVGCGLGTGSIDAAALQSARDRDIESHLSRIEYRGRTITTADFYKWQAQFPAALHPVTVEILRLIAERYYVSARCYWESLDHLLAEAGLTSIERVVFCLWQPLGKSNPAIMHDVTTHHKLRVMQHLDLTAQPDAWPRLTVNPPPVFTIVDDFLGTGNTMCSLWEKQPRPLVRLLEEYPGSRVIMIVIAALAEGVRRVEESLREQFGDCVRLHVGMRFDEGDRCFSESSRVVPHPANRAQLRQFCEEVGKRYFPKKLWFGYGASESLVVFHSTVPNNSLPILWHDEGGWFPLFPASGRAASQ